MKNNRLSRWKATLIAVDKIDNNISNVVDKLAKLDCKLIDWGKKHDPGSKIEKGTLDDFEEYETISYLWVLGAYEIIRTIHQRCKNNNIFTQETLNKIKDTKDYLAQLRIPLAKLEPERHHKDIDDYLIAFPHGTEEGMSWLLSGETCIKRIDLSNRFLELLEAILGPGSAN